MIWKNWNRTRRWAALIAALILVLLCGATAFARDLHDTVGKIGDSITGLGTALVVIAGLVGYLAKSPRQAAYSQKIMDAALFIQSGQMKRIIDALENLTEGKEGRRRLAIDLILEDPAADKLGITRDDAGQLVDYITAKYKTVPGLIKKVTDR